jgi:hypothetical protein
MKIKIPYQEECRKLKYNNKEEARNKIIEYHKKNQLRKKIPVAFYICDNCKGYHLTRNKQQDKSHNFNKKTLSFS